MAKEKTLFNIGRLSKTFGHTGQLKLVFTREVKPPLRKKSPIFLKIDQKAVPFCLKEIIYNDEKSALISLEDIDDNSMSVKLVGYEVLYPLKATETAETIDTSYQYLAGYDLFDQSEKLIGKIEEISASHGQILLKVISGQKELFIPFHDSLLLDIDPIEKYIAIEIAEGLTDLFS